MRRDDIKRLVQYLAVPVLILLTAIGSMGFGGNKFNQWVSRKELRDSLALINIQGVSASTLKDSMDRQEADWRDTSTVVWNDSAGALLNRSRADMRDSATVVWNYSAGAVLNRARADMRDSATVVWNDSVGSVETRAREDAGDTAEVYLALAKADMRDSSTVVWNDSIPAYTSRDSTRNKVLRPSSLPDSSVSGEVFYAIAGAALTFGDLVYWRNDTLYLANGDTTGATYLLPAAAMSADKTTGSGAVGMFLRTGYARAEGWIHLPIGGVVYVDTVATGQMSRYAPTVAGMGSQPVGVTVDSTSGVVDFRPTYVITVK